MTPLPPDLTPPHYRGTCHALIPTAQGVVACGSAAVTGALSDHLGLAKALGISAVLGIGATLVLLTLARRSYQAAVANRQALGNFEVQIDG